MWRKLHHHYLPVCRSTCISIFTEGQILYFVQGLHLLLFLMQDLTSVVILVLMKCQHFPVLNYHTSINHSGLSFQVLLIFFFLCLADSWKRGMNLFTPPCLLSHKGYSCQSFYSYHRTDTEKKKNQSPPCFHIWQTGHSSILPRIKLYASSFSKSFLLMDPFGWLPLAV